MKTELFSKLQNLGLFVFVLGGLWSALALYAVYPALPYNPAEIPLAEAGTPFIWLPQGWAFFTRDPREPRMLVYAQENHTWRSGLIGPHASPRNLFGMNRASKAQGVEIGGLFTAVKDSAWTACEDDVPTCLDAVPVTTTVTNIAPRPTLCGTVGLARQKPVPWAWSKSRDEIIMPSEILKIEVSCLNNSEN